MSIPQQRQTLDEALPGAAAVSDLIPAPAGAEKATGNDRAIIADYARHFLVVCETLRKERPYVGKPAEFYQGALRDRSVEAQEKFLKAGLDTEATEEALRVEAVAPTELHARISAHIVQVTVEKVRAVLKDMRAEGNVKFQTDLDQWHKFLAEMGTPCANVWEFLAFCRRFGDQTNEGAVACLIDHDTLLVWEHTWTRSGGEYALSSKKFNAQLLKDTPSLLLLTRRPSA